MDPTKRGAPVPKKKSKKPPKTLVPKPLPPVPKPERDCCQSGCFGCAWADAMRARGEL